MIEWIDDDDGTGVHGALGRGRVEAGLQYDGAYLAHARIGARDRWVTDLPDLATAKRRAAELYADLLMRELAIVETPGHAAGTSPDC